MVFVTNWHFVVTGETISCLKNSARLFYNGGSTEGSPWVSLYLDFIINVRHHVPSELHSCI